MFTQAQNNQVSFQLSPAEQKTVNDALAQIEQVLGPKLAALTPEGRHEMPKMGQGTVGFVGKALEYARAHPNLVPPYVDLPELGIDFEAAALLAEYVRRIGVLESGLSDTAMLSGSEAYAAALAFYASVRVAAKNGVPGAQPIYDDLSTRFPGRPAKKPQASA